MLDPHRQTARAHARRQAGFTLIELVAVLIVLGILAAVITSKYLDLTTQAQAAQARGLMSEAVARFGGAYRQYVLDTQEKPAALTDLDNASYLDLDASGRVNVGDYDFVYSQAGTTLSVRAYAKDGASALASTSISWP